MASVASSFVSTEEPRPRRTPPGAPSFSIRDAPFNEGVVTAVEQTSTLQPPEAAASQRGRRSSNASAERSVTFTPDLPIKASKGSKELSRRQRRQSSGSSSQGSPGSPREEVGGGGRKKRPHHRSLTLSKSSSKKQKKLKRIKHHRGGGVGNKTSGHPRDTPSPHRMRRRKRKKKRDIAIQGVTKFSDLEGSDVEDYAPPKHLSPRSAAEYVKNKLKEAAAKRKKKKKKKTSSKTGKKGASAASGATKKKRKRKKKRKGKRSDGFGDSDDDEPPIPRPKKPLGPADQHFYPTPRNLFKKRCLFSAETNPVVCTICDGIHYRTKRNFAANLRIIINVNKALGDILNEMRNRMKKIDTNLARVKRYVHYTYT